MNYQEIIEEIHKLDRELGPISDRIGKIKRALSRENLRLLVLCKRKWNLETRLIPASEHKYYAPKKGAPGKKTKEIDWEREFSRLTDEQKEKLIEDLMKGD